MKATYNLEFLESVKIFDKKKCYYLDYYPASKSIFGNRKEGFRSIISGNTFSADDLTNGKYGGMELLVEDNIAYYKPYVELTFTSGDKSIKTCYSYGDALMWGNSISKEYITKPHITY